MSNTLISGQKSIFAARQKYIAGKLTKAQFNQLVATEIFRQAAVDMINLPMEWRWLRHVEAYFELKRLGYE